MLHHKRLRALTQELGGIVTTFKSLSGGRFKCNQTGVVLTARRVWGYVLQLQNASRPKKTIQLLESRIWYFGREEVNFDCPHCQRTNELSTSGLQKRPFAHTCTNCHKKFSVLEMR